MDTKVSSFEQNIYCLEKCIYLQHASLDQVRYQNRKKLAEQRPRVRGQFVKQSGTESSSRTGDE